MWCCCVTMFDPSSVYGSRFFTSLQSWRTNKHTYVISTFRRKVAHKLALTERKLSLRELNLTERGQQAAEHTMMVVVSV